MLTPQNTPAQLDRLASAMAGAAKGGPQVPEPKYPATLRLPRQILSPGEAMARKEVSLPVSASRGRIASRLVSSCPPGIPLLVPGEEITAQTAKFLQSSGVERVFVVK